MPLRGLIGATEAIGHAEKQMCQRVLEERKPSANQVPFFGMKFFFSPSQVSSDPHRFILLTVGGLLRFPTLHLAAWKKKVFELVKVICFFFNNLLFSGDLTLKLRYEQKENQGKKNKHGEQSR